MPVGVCSVPLAIACVRLAPALRVGQSERVVRRCRQMGGLPTSHVSKSYTTFALQGPSRLGGHREIPAWGGGVAPLASVVVS
jgi:hypothetical protein